LPGSKVVRLLEYSCAFHLEYRRRELHPRYGKFVRMRRSNESWPMKPARFGYHCPSTLLEGRAIWPGGHDWGRDIDPGTAKLPETTPSASADRACCSGMTAIGGGMKDIHCGEARDLRRLRIVEPPAGPVALATSASHRRCFRERSLLMLGLVFDRPIPGCSGDESLRHSIGGSRTNGPLESPPLLYSGTRGLFRFRSVCRGHDRRQGGAPVV
jgi:hypothetical protein